MDNVNVSDKQVNQTGRGLVSTFIVKYDDVSG